MAQRIGMMMSIITTTFLVVVLVAIIRGVYLVRQKQRESKLREMMYFNKMKIDNEKNKAEKLKANMDDKEASGVVSDTEFVKSNIYVEESTQQVNKVVEIDWLTGEPIYEDK